MRVVVRAALAPVAGVALAALAGMLTGDQRARDVLAYAMATMPLAAALAALSGRAGAGSPRHGSAWVAALVALVAAFATACVLATIRFRFQGSVGLISLRALPFTREVLMLVGLLPAIALLAAALRRPGPAVSAGVLAGILAGPMLLVSAALGRVPLLNPVAVTFLVVLAIAWAGRRQRRSSLRPAG